MKKYITSLIIFIFIAVLFAATEDFTSFIEYDVNEVIAITDANTITVTDMTRGDSCYTKYDYGTGYFDSDFTAYIDVDVNSISSLGSLCIVGFSNTSNTLGDMITNNEGFSVYVYYSGGTKFYLNDFDTDAFDYYGVSIGSFFYFKIVRDGTDIGCGIYSNAACTTKLDSLAITGAETTYRYCVVAGARNSESSAIVSAVIENLEIEGGTPPSSSSKKNVIIIN